MSKLDKYLKNNKGFSLIEVTVSLAIAGFILTATAIFLSNVIAYNKKIQVRNEVVQNLQYSVEIVKRTIRQTPYNDFFSSASYSTPGGQDKCFIDISNSNLMSRTETLQPGERCGKRLTQTGAVVPVFEYKAVAGSNALFYYDFSQGADIQLTPSTVNLDQVKVKVTRIQMNTPGQPESAYIELDIRATDSEGVLADLSRGQLENEAASINTGVFLRRTSDD